MKKIQALVALLACGLTIAGAGLANASQEAPKTYVAKFEMTVNRAISDKPVKVVRIPNREVAEDEFRVLSVDEVGLYNDRVYKKSQERAYGSGCSVSKSDACWASYHPIGDFRFYNYGVNNISLPQRDYFQSGKYYAHICFDAAGERQCVIGFKPYMGISTPDVIGKTVILNRS